MRKEVCLMKKSVSIILVLAMILACLPINAFAAENDYACSDYTDCTADGSEIYIVTKDGCPIREEPHNKGKIYARAEKGQLIAVKRVFWTIKATRWCEISTDNGKPLYIHIDNCEPHVHSLITLLENDKGNVDFCTVCGFCSATANSNTKSCNLACVADQAFYGTMSEYDTSFWGVVAQIALGEVPGVGTVADVRDLIGDFLNGESLGVLAMDCIGLLPLVGAFKYADELSFVAKNADEVSTMKYLPWGVWDDYDKVVRDGQEYVKLGDFYYSHHAVDEFTPAYIKSNKINGVEHSRGISPTFINYIITEGVEDGVTLVKPARDGCMSYTNGIFEIIMDGDVVVTIKRMSKGA